MRCKLRTKASYLIHGISAIALLGCATTNAMETQKSMQRVYDCENIEEQIASEQNALLQTAYSLDETVPHYGITLAPCDKDKFESARAVAGSHFESDISSIYGSPHSDVDKVVSLCGANDTHTLVILFPVKLHAEPQNTCKVLPGVHYVLKNDDLETISRGPTQY